MTFSIIAGLREAMEAIDEALGPVQAPIGLVLGSGLGGLAEQVEAPRRLSYRQIPHLPMSTVPGHEGAVVAGRWQGRDVVLLAGRIHRYEGHPAAAVAFPIQLLAAMGVDVVIVTNAAGALQPAWRPGELMLISDHINWTGSNPLVGLNDDRLGPRFPDMTVAYDATLRQAAHAVAARQGVTLHEGVYAGVLGPSYETPAEVRMLRLLGGDAVGMSTVPEVIAARHLGMRVLGLSCLTNMAAGLGAGTLHHDEVKEVAGQATAAMIALLAGIVAGLDDARVRSDVMAAIRAVPEDDRAA